MATLTRTFYCTKDNTSRYNSKQGQGASDYLMVGRDTHGNIHRAFLDFSGFDTAANWNPGDKIVKIELVITTSNTHNFSFGSKPGFRIGRLANTTWSEGDAADGSWHTDDYRNISATYDAQHFWTPVPCAENDHLFLDITSLLEPCAPSRVLKRNGQPAGTVKFTGLKLISESEASNKYRVEFWGRGAVVANRPYIRVTYDVGTKAPNAPTVLTPSGDTSLSGSATVTGTVTFAQDTDYANSVEVRIWNSAGTTQVGPTLSETQDESTRAPVGGTASWSLTLPDGLLKVGTSYKVDARVKDQGGAASDWSSKVAFKVVESAPVITRLANVPVLDTLKNWVFSAAYTPTDVPLLYVESQFRDDTVPEDPAWGDTLIWDSGPVPTTGSSGIVEWQYGGPELVPDTTYDFRVRITDTNNLTSSWTYGTLTTSATYTEMPDEDYPDWVPEYDETAAYVMTGYNRVSSNWRIVLKAMGTNRGPGAIKAIIMDASNVGASAYANSPGECFFTLPADHPQIGECEPYQTHYSIQFYSGDRWVEKFAGILNDFDASEEEVVFHGIDYLGLPSLAVDERKNGETAAVISAGHEGTGGSKYSEVDISVIIRDQLFHGKNQANSTFGFISIPNNGTTGWSAMSEKVSLQTPYSPILGTITGLLESHRAGTGRRSRLMVVRTAENTYAWRLFDNYGKDRKDLRLEYGGLVNGYRLVGFGDFGTVVLGLGRAREGVKVLYASGSSTQKVDGQDMSAVFGRISKTAVWQDLYDETDLKRRVAERAMQVGKIGKRTALALRVDGLRPFDGFDLMDSVPVVINNGPVQTDHYGSELWTIWGVAWKLYPDGHEDITLTVLPKDDGTAISSDIIGTTPILSDSDWVIGRVPPTSHSSGRWYLDQTTGVVYMWDMDLEEWVATDPLDLLGAPAKPVVSSVLVRGVVNLQVTP
jgi:hypothetical protein